MKTWDLFLRDVMPSVPNVPEPSAEHAVHRAAQEFCRRTRAWEVAMDPITTMEGVVVYDIELPPQTELVRLERATLNGLPVTVWRDGDDAAGLYVFTPEGRQLLFSRTTGAGQRLALTAALRPSEAATGVDDVIFDLYVETIARGAVARLTGDPAKKADFEAECDRIKTDLWRGQAAIRPRARSNFF